MFGSSPGCFTNLHAVFQCALAYSMEEGRPWVLVRKADEAGRWFMKPCRHDDLTQAKLDGWEQIDQFGNSVS